MLERELQNFGLAEKEAKVYITVLELGTGTVQEISQKSGINRATTYIQIDSLMRRGLISSVDKDKKSVFMAEKPQRLLEILRDEKEKVESLENKFESLMPDFEAIYNVLADRPRVRFFGGDAGLNVVRSEIIRMRPLELRVFLPARPPKEAAQVEDPTFSKISRAVGSTKFLMLGTKNVSAEVFKWYPKTEARFFKTNDYRIDIMLFANKVVVNKPIKFDVSMATMIEDRMIYESFVAVFDGLWLAAQELEK